MEAYDGRDPNEIYEEEVAKRPVPAIEKPLGPRATEHQTVAETVVYDIDGAMLNWNDNMRGREWTG